MAGVKRPIFSSPNCTIVSPSPRSWPSKIWDSSRRAKADRTRAGGRTCLQGRAAGEYQRRLKSKGHPVGATGVGQICDVVQQIRGEAGERQVQRNSLGLAQNLGGSGATCVVTILGAV
jgi:hypothetical protein